MVKFFVKNYFSDVNVYNVVIEHLLVDNQNLSVIRRVINELQNLQFFAM